MIEPMTGVIQPYAWGSPTFIPGLLGTEPTDEPQAELWLGAHPSAPSTVAGRSLGDVIAADPVGVLGQGSVDAFGPRLPYLLKVLAAAQPLSLQAHPSRAEAEAGFAREQAEGIAADAKDRLFKDDWPKPEMLCALVDAEALCGFRAPEATYALFEQLGARRGLELATPLADLLTPEPERVEQVFSTIMRLSGADADEVISEIVTHAERLTSTGELGTFARTATELAAFFPGDPGVLAALLMNRVAMAPGEAVFLPAGNLHAYLHGAGIEIMANSDNVLRGGLTAKHVDLDALLEILDFAPGFPGLVEPEEQAAGVWRYPTPAPEFALWKLSPGADAVVVPEPSSGRSLLVVDGEVTLRSGEAALELTQGHAAFLSAGAPAVLEGTGTAFLAGPGV